MTGPVSAALRRVAVVGPGGAGKSTFALALGARTGLPVVHLDRHHWRPGWVEPPDEEWAAIQGKLTAAERWIMDGNYGGSSDGNYDLRFARADVVVVFAFPRWRCVAGALGRTLRHHGSAVQAEGCPEHIDLVFLRWIWRFPLDSRPRLDAALRRHAGRLRVVEVRSRRQALACLEALAADGSTAWSSADSTGCLGAS